MQYLVAIVLIAGAIGWAILADEPLQQTASADEVPRQISQLSR